MAPKVHKERGFDNAKLQNMAEPLTIRVVKIKANTKQPIELPGKDGSAPGTNMTREDVLKLEGFIREWSGGGYYEGQVTDANGLSMEWPFGWDPRLYPEKIPPSDAQNVNIGAVTSGAYAPLPMPMIAPTSAIPQLGGGSNIPLGGGVFMPPGAQPLGQNPTQSAWPPPTGAYMNYPPSRSWPEQQQAQPQQQPQAQPQQQPQPQVQQGYAPLGFGQQPFQPGFLDYARRFQGAPAAEDRERDRDRSDRDRDRTERDRERREGEERARMLEDQLRRADLERKEIEHKAMLERQAQQHAQEMAAMREEIRRIAETNKLTENDEIRRIREEKAAAERQAEQRAMEQRFAQLQELIARTAEAKAPAVDTGAIEKMREMERRLEQERHERDRAAERERAEREREKERYERDREREKFEQQLLAMQAQQANALAALQSNRPDPMVELMREQSRMQAETAREIARAQDASAAKMSAFMVNPMEMMRVIKDSSSGSDQMIRNIVDSFSGVFGTYRQALESVAQIQGSGAPSPMVGIIQDGLSHGKDVMEQWMNMQRDKGVAEAKAKQLEAQAAALAAQASIARAQADAQHEQNEHEQRGWSAPPPIQQPSMEQQVAYQQQLQYELQQQQRVAVNGNGAMNGNGNGNGAAAPTPTPMAQEEVPPLDMAKLPELITAADVKVLVHPAVVESVSRLRKGVRAFMESKGQLDPKTGQNVGIMPVQAVNAILQGINMVQQTGLQIPAFGLFEQQRFPEMMDLLLATAPQGFRDECVAELTRRANGEVVEPKDPEDPELDDEDEDEEEEDEDNEPTTPPAAVAKPAAKPVSAIVVGKMPRPPVGRP